MSGLGTLDLLQATQHDCAEQWFCMSHSLSCFRFMKVRRFVTSILSLFGTYGVQCLLQSFEEEGGLLAIELDMMELQGNR